MRKFTVVLVLLLTLVGLQACGDDKEGNSDAIAKQCRSGLNDVAAQNENGDQVPVDDICKCYGDAAAEQYSTDELNDLLAKGHEAQGREALTPLLISCASDNGVDLSDTDAPDDGTSGTDSTDTGS
jgi:hypothetical protein